MKKSIFHIYGLLFLIVAFCAPLPTNNDSSMNSIRLSLEKIDRDSAVFSGEPIHAIVETGDSTYFSSLAWHTGMGKIDIPEEMINSYAKKFDVYLYWRSYPAKKDLVSKTYWDTVFVSIGGSLKESNKTVIRVTNLPVVIDSVLVGDTIFNGDINFWRYLTNDSIAEVPIVFYARDFDGKVPDVTFSGNRGFISQSSVNPLQMRYLVPHEYLNDTIHFLVFDHLGAKQYRDLNIKPFRPNIPPIVDSIVFQDTTLKGNVLYHIGFASFDTLRFTAYVHDPEGTDVSCMWKSYVSSRIVTDNVFNNKMSYICTTGVCNQVHQDTTVLVDTIKLVVTDANMDSTIVKIELVKGDINYPPVIEEITIEDSLFEKPDSVISFPIEYQTIYNVKFKAADSQNDSLKVKWTGIPLSQLTFSSDTGITFTSSEAQITDTLEISVSDYGLKDFCRIIFLAPEDR